MSLGRVAIAPLVAAVTAGTLAILWLLTGSPEPQEIVIPLEPLPLESAATLPETRVINVVGTVERQGGAEQWTPVRAGEQLRLQEELRTGPGASADLSVGDDSTIRVASESQLAVIEITRAVQRINLKRGRLGVEHASDGTRRLRIEDEQGRAVVAASPAKFDVQRSGASFAVATTTGRVNLAAAGTQVEVGAGQQAAAYADAAPTPPAAIPTHLLLKVARATQQTSNDRLCVVIEGSASTGSRVLVQGVEAAVQTDGSFRVSVPRTPGQQDAKIVIEDVLGRRREQTVACAKILRRIKDMSVKWGDRSAGKPVRWPK